MLKILVELCNTIFIDYLSFGNIIKLGVDKITYLYKEVLLKFKEKIDDISIIDKDNTIVELKNEYLCFFLCPELIENNIMYKNLVNNNTLYITYGNFNKIAINKVIYTNILNIGDKYNICISLKKDINKDELKYICLYIAILFSDIIVINKIKSIDDGIKQLDIALDLGKDIYAIPGDIFEYKNYLANFAIKQGAIPVCSIYDMKYILKEKEFNVL